MNTKRKVLVARRSPSDVAPTLSLLDTSTLEGIGTSDFDEAKRLLSRQEPHLIVCDVRFGAFNGLQLVLWNLLRDPQSRGILIDVSRDHILESDATRYCAMYLVNPSSDALKRAMERSFVERPRQSIRRELAHPFPVDVGRGSAMMINVSYGGLCLRGDDLLSHTAPSPFQFTVRDANLRVVATRIWSQRTPGGREVSCGAAVLEQSQLTWREFVDGVAAT